MLVDIRDILKSSGLNKTLEITAAADGCGVTEFEKEYIFSEDIFVHAELTNIKGMIRAVGKVNTVYEASCARCLKPLRIPLENSFEDEYVQFGSLGPVAAEDADVFEYSDKEIDLGLSIRNAVLLSLPIRHLCVDGCQSICQICGKNLNESKCGCEEQPNLDPRFEELLELLDRDARREENGGCPRIISWVDDDE